MQRRVHPSSPLDVAAFRLDDAVQPVQEDFNRDGPGMGQGWKRGKRDVGGGATIRNEQTVDRTRMAAIERNAVDCSNDNSGNSASGLAPPFAAGNEGGFAIPTAISRMTNYAWREPAS